jgi:hypothetical protein
LRLLNERSGQSVELQNRRRLLQTHRQKDRNQYGYPGEIAAKLKAYWTAKKKSGKK